MARPTVLVVDDELSIRESFSLILDDYFHVETAASGETAVQKASSQMIDLVFLDIRMPGMDGMETLPKLKKIMPNTPVVMVTAVNDVQSAGQTIKDGAEDYIVKPFDVEEVLKKARFLLERKNVKAEAARLRATSPLVFQKPPLFGKGRKMDELAESIQHATEVTHPVLLMGEPGSEFDSVAERIHLESPRARGPFEIVRFSPHIGNAEAEYELFGQPEKEPTYFGKGRSGAFQRARGGTLYLSHVGHMPGPVQDGLAAKLDDDELPENVRVIASWVNRLPEDQAVTALHPALFETISSVTIEIPTFAERLADFETMIQDILEFFSQRHAVKTPKLSQEAKELLEGYPYKGGILELQGIMENLILRVPADEITAEDLPLDVWIYSRVGGKIPYTQFAEKFEKKFLTTAVRNFGNNLVALSKRLGLSPVALQAKLEQHHIL